MAESPGLPLEGRRVVVTRSRAQASSLVEGLTLAGATVVELPVIDVVEASADGGTGLGRAATNLVAGAYTWVALTSANAVPPLVAALAGRPVPDWVRWAAVGPGTASALADAGYPTDLVPRVSVSDSLAEAFPRPPVPGSAVLFPRAEIVRGALASGLEAKGWTVDQVVAYRTVAGAPAAAALAAAGDADAIAFTSSSTVDRTIDLLGIERVPAVVVTIGPITSEAARSAGLKVAAEASDPTIACLVCAVTSALGIDGAGSTGLAQP